MHVWIFTFVCIFVWVCSCLLWPWMCLCECFMWVSCCFVMHVGGLTFLPIVPPWCGHTYILKQQGWGGQRSRRSAVTWSLPSCTAHSRRLLGSKNNNKNACVCVHASLCLRLENYMTVYVCISAIMEEIAAATCSCFFYRQKRQKHC